MVFVVSILVVFGGGVVWVIGLGFGCLIWLICEGILIVFILEFGIYGFIEFGNWFVIVFLIVVVGWVIVVVCL